MHEAIGLKAGSEDPDALPRDHMPGKEGRADLGRGIKQGKDPFARLPLDQRHVKE